MEVYSPRQTGAPGLCEEIIPTKEVLFNRELIDPLWLARKGTQRALRKHVPSLDEALRMRVQSVESHNITAKDGAHFLRLILANEEGEKGGIKHMYERDDLWRALEMTRGLDRGSLSWRAYNPTILLAYIPPRAAPDETAQTLGKVIRGVLPLPVTLQPAEFPTL
jgi:hypothetical protein